MLGWHLPVAPWRGFMYDLGLLGAENGFPSESKFKAKENT
jgi:hypothetical protein